MRGGFLGQKRGFCEKIGFGKGKSRKLLLFFSPRAHDIFNRVFCKGREVRLGWGAWVILRPTPALIFSAGAYSYCSYLEPIQKPALLRPAAKPDACVVESKSSSM